VVGWFRSASAGDRSQVLDYINRDDAEIHWSFIRLAWSSVAYTAIVPMQDLLGLDSPARMNLPGTTSSNWVWRAKATDFSIELADKLAHITSLFGRTKRVKTKI
jgi:4-alpha-glucanotransferase